MTPTYLQFHLWFVVPPLVGLAVLARHRLSRRVLAGIGVLAAVALVYSTPWDNYLIMRGVWFYGEGTLALRFGYTPLGEYLFFVFQPVLTGLWLVLVQPSLDPEQPGRPLSGRLAGTVGWLLVAAAGGALLLTPDGFYLGAILVWAAPVLAFQWAAGGNVLWRYRRALAVGVAVPTLYLCAVDRLAIGWGIWTIAAESSTGLTVLGLPVEEAVFFLVTNLLVVQGLLLWHWVLARVDAGGVRHGVAGLLPSERVMSRWR